MERALLRADLERPGFLLAPELAEIRYALNFARLTVFQPGAAARGGPSGRTEVLVEDEVEPVRAAVVEAFDGPLRLERRPADRLHRALAVARELRPKISEARARILERHANELSAAELDDEVGRKVLVSIAGGGGGAGFVYVGAYDALEREGIVPAYVIGSSIGALLGLFRARRKRADWNAYAALAASLEAGSLFGPPTVIPRHGLTGLFRLHLHAALGKHFLLDDGRPATIADLEIPYEAVIAGVRRRSLDRLPKAFLAPLVPSSGERFSERLATLMWHVGAFFDPRLVKAIVVGGDPETAAFDALDAAGFSAAIPGVFHYECDAADERMAAILVELCRREDVAAFVDGGVASNVPIEIAWRRVQAGKLGTRNAVYLAFDCFHPQWDPKHLWLQPITQALQLQLTRDAPFGHWIVRFESTLSPLTLVPDARAVESAVGWGRAAIAECLPLVRKLLEPFAWRPEA